MSTTQLRRHVRSAWLTMILLLSVGMLSTQISGCGYFHGVRERSWSEDVLLEDGSVITIDRYVQFDESNALGGGAYSATETKATLSFRGDLAALPVWNAPLIPLVLYRDRGTGEWVLVATTASCGVWRERTRPMPPYWEYREKGETWQESKLSEESLGQKTNLFFSYNSKLSSSHFTMRGKREAWSDSTISKRFLTVLGKKEHEGFCWSK